MRKIKIKKEYKNQVFRINNKKTQEIKIKYQYKEIQIIIYYKIQSHIPKNLQLTFNNKIQF